MNKVKQQEKMLNKYIDKTSVNIGKRQQWDYEFTISSYPIKISFNKN